MLNRQKVAVIGLWHLGCTVSASLAKQGYEVMGLDFDEKLIANLNQAVLPIAEPGLSELAAEMLKSKNLNFSSDFSILKNFPFVVIGYDTPVNDQDQPDLEIVNRAVAEIQKFAGENCTVILMSQIPAGTSRKIFQQLRTKHSKIEVVYNPENLRLSQAIETYVNADRQIIGVSSPEAEARMREFYGFYKNSLMFMSLESAELVKHGVNSFLAMSVSFINQLADLSEAVGGNIMEVIKGLKSDTRIGQKAFLSPGLGFAGGTLGRDLRVLEDLGKEKKVELSLVADVYAVNQNRKEIFYKKLTQVLPELKGKKICILGLVYKPGTNTLRRSLSLEIGKWLVSQGAEVAGFDPALSNPTDVLPIKLAIDPYQASSEADVLILITEWPEFKSLDFHKIKIGMKGNLIFDTKNILNPVELKTEGFKYFGTGISNEI